MNIDPELQLDILCDHEASVELVHGLHWGRMFPVTVHAGQATICPAYMVLIANQSI